jgi:hypothetical protein
MAARESPRRGRKALTCSSLGPLRANVQRGCNTQFEFVLRRLRRLDKTTISQHAGVCLASPRRSDSGSSGWTGAGI